MVHITVHQAKAVDYFRKNKVCILINCRKNMNSYRSYHNILFISYSDHPFSFWFIHSKYEKKKITCFIFLPVLHKHFLVTIEICITRQGPVQTINFSCCTLWTKVCLFPSTVSWHLPCQIRKDKTTALGYISFWKIYLPRIANKGHRRAQKVPSMHKK